MRTLRALCALVTASFALGCGADPSPAARPDVTLVDAPSDVGDATPPDAPDASVDAADASVDAPADAASDAPADAAVVPDDVPFTCPRMRPRPPDVIERCNGSAALCDRRYDQVAYPTTHNAFSSEEDHFVPPNQRFGLARQLRDGVRGLMLDVHPYQDDVWLCHGVCVAGRRRLVEGLCDVARFLDANPTEVVTILFESYVPPSDVAAAFNAVGLLSDVHAQAEGTEWPSLRQMVRTNRRLVVFSDRDDGTYPWHHDMWQWAQENPFEAMAPADLDCRSGRGHARNPLFILNHFLTAPFASPELARMVNFNPALLDHARRCQAERMRLPNFVTVDFYDLGDLFAATAALNAAAP